MNVQVFFKECFPPLDETLTRKLQEASKIECYEKGKRILEAGDLQSQLPILIDGVFRGFLIDADGSDITDCFAYHSGEILTGCHALGEHSPISIEAVTTGRCLTIPMEIIFPMIQEQPEMMTLYNSYLLAALTRQWEEKMLLHRYTAMQRYLWFLRMYPGMIDLVSNKYIASFLGMTPVTLSRLRRNLRESGGGQQ